MKYWSRIVVVAAFVLGVLLFLPSTVYLAAPGEFSCTYADILLAGLVCAGGCAAILVPGLFLLRRLGGSWLTRALALLGTLAVLVWLQANFLLWPYGPFDGRDIHWEAMASYGYVDGALWVAAIAAALAFPRAVARGVAPVCALLLAIQVTYLGVLLVRQPEVPSFKRYLIDEHEKFSFSRQRNVIVVVLDSFPTDVFWEIARRNPGVTAPFDGFIHFRNSLGSFPFTELSVAAALTGRTYDNSEPIEAWMRRAYESRSLPAALKAAGWRVDLFPKVSYSLHYSEAVASNLVRGMPAAVRLREVAVAFDLALFRAAPHALRRLVYNDQQWRIRPLVDGRPGRHRLRSDAVPRVVVTTGAAPAPNPGARFQPRAYSGNADVRFVDEALSSSAFSEAPATFKFYHLGTPHIPLTLTENLLFRRMPVNRRNYVRSATAGLKLIGMLLDHLRGMGLYDQSMIFVIGDHGASLQGVPFVRQPGMRLTRGTRLISDPIKTAALPLVLVKPFGSAGPVRVSDAPVSLTDIPATVFDSLGMPGPAPGASMLTIPQSVARERRFYTYQAGDHLSYYGDMTEYLVTGYAWQEESWVRSGRLLTKAGIVWQRPPVVGRGPLQGDPAASR